ncbi:MAG: ParB/RepB/Spo0J family partition protein [Terriglobia bacterium]
MSTATVIAPPKVKETENPLIQEISLDSITPSALNPRGSMDSSALAELAANIKTHGVLQPILVRPVAEGKYEIVCGERRYRASKTAGRQTIPARIVNLSDAESLEFAVIENLMREDVHELDEAEGYARLLAMNPNYTPEVLAQKVCKSVAYIYRRLQLLKLDSKLKQLFLDGHMTVAHASILARLQPRDQAEVLSQLNHAGKKGAIEFPSVARLQSWVEENIYLSLQGAPFKKDDAVLLPEAGACTACPKRTGFNPSLFPEIKKHDLCLDRECFRKKQNAFVQIKFNEAPAGSVKIATSWQFGGKEASKDVLTRDQYHESKKGSCEQTVQAIVAQGENIGATQWVCVSKDGNCPVHGVSSQYVGESPQAKAARLKREAEARLELTRRRAIFEAIREKARKVRSLDLPDYRLVTSEFFARLHFDTSKQFVVANGYVTPAMAKQRKVEPSGSDNGNDYAKYFENLIGNADLKQLGTWLTELALIQHRDHAPYSYAGDKTVRDPLMETAKRWAVITTLASAAVDGPSKPAKSKKTTKPNTNKKAKRS